MNTLYIENCEHMKGVIFWYYL